MVLAATCVNTCQTIKVNSREHAPILPSRGLKSCHALDARCSEAKVGCCIAKHCLAEERWKAVGSATCEGKDLGWTSFAHFMAGFPNLHNPLLFSWTSYHQVAAATQFATGSLWTFEECHGRIVGQLPGGNQHFELRDVDGIHAFWQLIDELVECSGHFLPKTSFDILYACYCGLEFIVRWHIHSVYYNIILICFWIMWNRSETEQAWPVDVVTPLDGLRKALNGKPMSFNWGGSQSHRGFQY